MPNTLLHRYRRAAAWLAPALLLALLAALYGAWVLFKRNNDAARAIAGLRFDPIGLDAFAGVPVPPRAPGQPRVVIFGDSRAAEWPAALPGHQVINRGIGSQTTDQLLLRLDAHVLALEPDIVVIQAGVNDLRVIPQFPGRRDDIIERSVDNLAAIVGRLSKRGVTVVLTTVFPHAAPPFPDSLFWSPDVAAAIAEANRSLAGLAGPRVIVLDSAALLAGPDGLVRPEWSRDLLHLSPAGYRRLDQALLELPAFAAP